MSEKPKLDLRSLIAELMALRSGEDFALFCIPGGEPEWEAHLVGHSLVMLGEVTGKYVGAGRTPEEAVIACIAKVVEA